LLAILLLARNNWRIYESKQRFVQTAFPHSVLQVKKVYLTFHVTDETGDVVIEDIKNLTPTDADRDIFLSDLSFAATNVTVNLKSESAKNSVYDGVSVVIRKTSIDHYEFVYAEPH